MVARGCASSIQVLGISDLPAAVLEFVIPPMGRADEDLEGVFEPHSQMHFHCGQMRFDCFSFHGTVFLIWSISDKLVGFHHTLSVKMLALLRHA